MPGALEGQVGVLFERGWPVRVAKDGAKGQRMAWGCARSPRRKPKLASTGLQGSVARFRLPTGPKHSLSTSW
eukprot:8290739-Pyramimonas_sp.AAC.1